jgi:hypothetical protein
VFDHKHAAQGPGDFRCVVQEGDAALAWSLQRLGAVLVAPKAGATLLVTGSRSAAAQGAASVLAVDDLLVRLS